MAKSSSEKRESHTCHVIVGRTWHPNRSEVINSFVASSKEGNFSVCKVHDSVKECVGFCGRLVDCANDRDSVVSLWDERAS